MTSWKQKKIFVKPKANQKKLWCMKNNYYKHVLNKHIKIEPCKCRYSRTTNNDRNTI